MDTRESSSTQPPNHQEQSMPAHEGSTPSEVSKPLPIVGIGASAGGLEALQGFFKEIPCSTGAAFVVVVHLSPDFKSLMPELLSKHTQMPVIASRHNTAVEPNHVYIIPPRKNIFLKEGALQLIDQDRSPGHTLNLPIDLFFSSLATEAKEHATAIILSGTGSDGSLGIGRIKEHGGVVLVQDEESAKFGGMPYVAKETRLADLIAPPGKLAEALAKYFNNPLERPSDSQENLTPGLHRILTDASGLDLSYYRSAMVERRVTRRMGLSGYADTASYLEMLERTPEEALQLVKDLLIGVTSFFRDPDVFEKLKTEILPDLFAQKEENVPVRVWVPACSTGEEVYSMAIVLAEVCEKMEPKGSFIIFATDIDNQSIDKAAQAEYLPSLLTNVSISRLNRYFFQSGERYVVHPDLRKHIRFAQHNLLKDSPFSKIDLVSCRNFLIYLNTQKQEHVLSSLHFALNQQGTLLLGPAESVVGFEAAFETTSLPHKLFKKTSQFLDHKMYWTNLRHDPNRVVTFRQAALPKPASTENQGVREVLDALVEMNNHTVVVLTIDGLLLELIGDPYGLFRLPKGKATNNLSKLIVPELHPPLMAGLHRLKKGQGTVIYHVDFNDQHLRFHLSIFASKFDQSDKILLDVYADRSSENSPSLVPEASWDEKATEVIRELELELQNTKENLQAMIEELQTTNEEQQSTNEELVASNEELQSTNEELQSVNEELYTVNNEFQNKNQELSVLALDLENLIQAIKVGTLYLDHQLTIRKFTPAVTDIIPILSSDLGRPLRDLVHGLNYDVLGDIQAVLDTGELLEKEVRSSKGAWILMRCHPYLTKGTVEGGVLITFVDITTLKNAQEFSLVVNTRLEEANRILVEQSAELEDLFSILAHDLKRPVIALDGLLSLMTEGGNTPMKEMNTPYLHKAQEECRRMQRLLQDLTQVSDQSRQKMIAEEVSLQPFLDTLITKFQEEAQRKEVRINATCDPMIVHVPLAVLEQVGYNLIENALKYGCSNPLPRIDIACHFIDNKIHFSVSDNGMGIAPSNHTKVFELFRRLDPKASDGSGVGLVAVRRSIQKLGGNVHLDSSEGRGSKFTVTLPIRQAESTTQNEEYQVLLIEDDQLDAKIVQRNLEEITSLHDIPFALTWVKSLAAGKEMLLAKRTDLILLDLSLPDGHGLNFLKEIGTLRNDPYPVVILSGHGDGIPFSSLKDQHISYLPKDVLDRESLKVSIDSVLEKTGRKLAGVERQ